MRGVGHAAFFSHDTVAALLGVPLPAHRAAPIAGLVRRLREHGCTW